MQTKTKYKVAFYCTYKVETVKFVSAGISGVCVCVLVAVTLFLSDV